MNLKYTFQDPISPIMYGISALHDHILFFLAMVLFVVLYIFVSTTKNFYYSDNLSFEFLPDKDEIIVKFPRTFYILYRIVDGRLANDYKNYKFRYQ